MTLPRLKSAIIWAVLALAATPAAAQTSMTRAQLEADINKFIVTNGHITSVILKPRLNNLAASMPTLLDPNTFIQTQTLSVANGSIALRALETADTGWSGFGNPVGVFATQGNQNAIVGYELNNLAANTNALPAAGVFFGKVTSAGDEVFGVYGLGEVWGATGVAVAAEFTARNKSGVAADTNLPPNLAIGTTTVVPNALQVTCGGLNGCAVGVLIAPEGGSSNAFNAAEYISGAGYSTYGLFVDAAATGNQTAAVLKGNGNGEILHMLVSGAAQPNNAVMDIVNSSNVEEFFVKQSGAVFMNGALTAAGANFSNTLALAPPSGLNFGLTLTEVFTGATSSSAGFSSSFINITSDNAAITTGGGAYLIGFDVQDLNFGGSAAQGGRIMGTFQLIQTAASSLSSPLSDYVGEQGFVKTLTGDGGTSGSPKGEYFGGWSVVQLGASATFVSAMTGHEFDLEALTGSSVSNKSGINITHSVNDRVSGSVNDNMVWLYGGDATHGSNIGIQFGRTDISANGGVNTGGALIAAVGAYTYLSGVDFSQATFTGFAWKSPGSTIGIAGDAVFRSANLSAIPTSAGSGGLFVCVDSTGNTYKKATCP